MGDERKLIHKVHWQPFFAEATNNARSINIVCIYSWEIAQTIMFKGIIRVDLFYILTNM